MVTKQAVVLHTGIFTFENRKFVCLLILNILVAYEIWMRDHVGFCDCSQNRALRAECSRRHSAGFLHVAGYMDVNAAEACCVCHEVTGC